MKKKSKSLAVKLEIAFYELIIASILMTASATILHLILKARGF